MNYLSVENLTKSFGINNLFENLTFGIEKGQKIALVARNGAGKTSLFRILAGLDTPDSGAVTYNREVRLGFLSQEQELDNNKTILDNIFSADSPKTRAIAEYERAIESHDEKAMQKAHDAMDRNAAWDYEARVKEVLGKLDIHDLDRITGQLSGGQKRRISLAKVLIEEPDLVLLDEPTNHLDLEMIEWLEEFLSQSNMTIFMITHDRYFLENITDEILELENKTIYRYKGNFSYYLEKKAERDQLESVVRGKQEMLFKKELEWARKMPRARTVKSKSRMDNFFELKQSLVRSDDPDALELEINMSRMGSKIVEFHKVRKTYGEQTVLAGFDYVFKNKEKIGIVGRNGTGKTTFLNMLTKQIEPDGGKVVVGETVVFGYFNQQGMTLKEGQRLLECVREVADFIPLTKGKTITASQMLERFMFARSSHSTFVEKLSGGERKRLQLLLVLMKNPNFLILDEPTNDLDVFTLAALEDYLLQYPGCLLIVSHDRYFLDKLVDHIFVLDGDGQIRDIFGNYDTYRRMEEADALQRASQKRQNNEQKQVAQKAEVPKIKLSFKEKHEYDQLEKEIPQLEKEKKELEEKLNNTATNHEELLKITDRLGQVVKMLDEKGLRWLELSEFM
ncbi:MAG: ABC-F family ATP-binding cassette domain-containing protein [Flavobacteriales bacterium]|nr:ABC-F family ATP-binding cassette domain-containing protein [Flavobacteriales bacterium]